MSGVYLFPFGQADCFLLKLDCGKEKKHILIDGGSRRWLGASLSIYLEKADVAEIDLLILTHLHQDHLGWLTEITDNMNVKKAILPISANKIIPCIGCFQNSELKEDCEDLQKIEKNLKKSGTFLVYANELEDYYTVSMGEWKLTLLYPSKNIIMPFAGRLGHCETEQNLISKINWDSMVWILHKKNEMKALFCGDCPESCFLDRFRYFKKTKGFINGMDFLKLSHHGRNDKGTVYFTENIMKETEAKKILITNVKENISVLKKQWGVFEDKIIIIEDKEKWISLS